MTVSNPSYAPGLLKQCVKKFLVSNWHYFITWTRSENDLNKITWFRIKRAGFWDLYFCFFPIPVNYLTGNFKWMQHINDLVFKTLTHDLQLTLSNHH